MKEDIQDLILVKKTLIRQRDNSHEMLKKLDEMKTTGITEGINIPDEEIRVRKNLVLTSKAITLCDKLIKNPGNKKVALELKRTIDAITTFF